MKSSFDTIYQSCVNVNLTLKEVGDGNVGVENENGQNFVVILDAETAKRMPHTDDNAWPKPNCQRKLRTVLNKI